MLVLGGLLTALGTSDKASGLVQELLFGGRPASSCSDLKLMVLDQRLHLRLLPIHLVNAAEHLWRADDRRHA